MMRSDTLRYRAMALLAWMALHGPRALTYAVARAVAALAYRSNAQARRAATDHVRHALGPGASEERVQRAVRGCIRAAAYYYADLGTTPRMDPRRFLAEHLTERGFHHITRAFGERRGVIIATIHYGNPEYVAQGMAARGFHIYGITEPLEPRALAALYQRLRDSHGHTLVPVGHSAIKGAIRHLRAGGVLCIMTDRDIQHAGVTVPFLGGTARIPTGAVDLARHTGAALIPAITRRRGRDHFTLFVGSPLPLVRTEQPDADRRLNAARLIRWFEPYLRRDPSQWFVLQESIFVTPAADAHDAPPRARILTGDGYRRPPPAHRPR